MERERLMEIIDSNGRFNFPTVELELLADHLIANGIGDIAELKAENVALKATLESINIAKTDTCSICGKGIESVSKYGARWYEGEPICENCCINVLQSRIEELKGQLSYECGCNSQSVETQNQLTAEKHRADVAEEALKDIYEYSTSSEYLGHNTEIGSFASKCFKRLNTKIETIANKNNIILKKK